MEEITVENPVIHDNKDDNHSDTSESNERSWSVKQFADEVNTNANEMKEHYKEIELLKSSHMVLLKLDGYMSMKIPSDVPILFGGKERDIHGKFKDDGKDGRFLLFFYDMKACFVVALSLVVLFGELSIISAIVQDLIEENCGVDANGPNTSGYALLLCSMYAAHVANERFGGILPIEIHELSFPALVALRKMRDEDLKKGLDNNKAHSTYYKMKFNEDEQKEIAELVKPNDVTFSNGNIVYFMLCFLEIINFYLLYSVSLLMATSGSTLSLIQNFISVEIVIQFHEIVPLAFNIVDPFPSRYNVSIFGASNLMVSKFDVKFKDNFGRIKMYFVWFGALLFIYWISSYSCQHEE